MQKAWLTIKNREGGFSVVEALLAVTVFGMLVTALTGAFIYGRESTSTSGDHNRAVLLAEEGLEAARNMANASYGNLVDGTYGAVQSTTQWSLSGSSDTTGIYTRQITVATAGTNRKSVASTVTWSTGGRTGSVTLTTRIVNWEAVLSAWSNATRVGAADATGTTDGLKVAVSGNYAYLVRNTTTSNFIICDISTPASVTIKSTTTFSGTPTNVAVSGNYAYVTTSTAATALEVIDVSNSTAPTLAKSVTMVGTVGANGVYLYGQYAYVARSSDATTNANELTVVSIATPASAAVVGGYNNNIQMNEVYVSGIYAYVATSSTTQEMLVINVSNPVTPTLAATYNPATTLAALTITGYGKTVLLGMSTTLDAINVTTPTAPARLGTFTAAGTINDVDVDITNQYAFIATNSTTAEYQVVTIGTPASMALSKSVDIAGTTSTGNGVVYSTAYDEFIGATASDTQELVTVVRN